MRYFANALPGIGPILAEELGARSDIGAVDDPVFDGRNDVVGFEARGDANTKTLCTAEDVFVEVGQAERARSSRDLISKLLGETALSRALSVYATQSRPLRAKMSVRTIARVLSEKNFRRTQLRDWLTESVLQQRPKWYSADPADVELWALEAPADAPTQWTRLANLVQDYQRDAADPPKKHVS